MKTLLIILSLLIGYLLGSINPAIIYSRLKGRDIRTLGSKNAGATNTLRNFGKGAALIVTLSDILKCVAAILAASLLARLFAEDELVSKVFAATGSSWATIFRSISDLRAENGCALFPSPPCL